MSNTVVMVHGLANKPKAELLERWWSESIVEGIRWRGLRMPKMVRFEMAYWASLMYDAPIDPVLEVNSYRPRTTAPHAYKNGHWDRITRELKGIIGDALDWVKIKLDIDTIAKAVLAVKMHELYSYYNVPSVRARLDGIVDLAITRALSRGDRVVLVAHSMGTIVCYNVLRAMESDIDAPRIQFVTLGSPLGMPHVKMKLVQEYGNVRVPTNVARWSNFADRRDPVAVDPFLRDDFEPSRFGVAPVDDLVLNEWAPVHHKSYDYLRRPEVASAIWAGLSHE